MPLLLPPIAVIEFTFSPVISVGEWSLRLETIALAAVILAALVVTASVARRTPLDVARPPDALDPDTLRPNHLRADDTLYIAVGAVPGAVVFGRIGYVVTHLDYYASNPAAVIDPGQGGLELSLAVVGGTLTGALVAALLGSPVRRWMHAAILPLLLAIAGGKLAMVLGGDGQGLPWDGAWATAYLGPGPWDSLAPGLPSHPSQAYEGLASTGVLVVLGGLLALGAFAARRGEAFLLGIAGWCVVRAIIATTWRDPVTYGDLRADQVLSLAVAAGALVLLVVLGMADTWRARRRPAGAGTPGTGTTSGEPDWPDPASRPRI